MRLDKFLAEKYSSRTKASQAIEAGLVLVNGKQVAPSYEFKDSDKLEFLQPSECFVSNGGYKLNKAIKDFNFSVNGAVVADIGASNGGFTDCLFKNGAKKVYCIDVGESQLDESLLNKNVIVIDNFNARNLNRGLFEERLDGVVVDVSFISLTYILKNIAEVLDDGGWVIALIKPQFECESKKVGKNGIVREPEVRKRIVKKIIDYAHSCSLTTVKLTNAPIKQGKNIEYLFLAYKNGRNYTDIIQLFKYAKF